jgi:predicted DNA-binding protein
VKPIANGPTLTFHIGERLKVEMVEEAQRRGMSAATFVREAIEDGIIKSKAKRAALRCEGA